PTISSENGETAAARRAIIFSSDKYFSAKCEWVRTWRISARTRRRNRRLHRPREEQLLRVHPDNSQQSRLHPALLRLEQVQTRRRQPPDRRRRPLLYQRRKRPRLRFPRHRLVRPQRPPWQLQPLEGRPPCRPGRLHQ